MFSRTESFKQYIRLYPIVSTLLFINIFLFIVSLLPFIGNIIYSYGIGNNYYIFQGEYWRLITPMFLHLNFFHLLFNMFSLYLFGPELEQLAGKARFLTIYFLSGLIGNVATYFIYDFSLQSLGASGAIYGILGAFGALVYYTKHIFPQLKQIILPIIVIGVIMTFIQPNINIAAHLAGLITGFLLGFIYFHPKRIAAWKKKRRKFKVMK